MKKRFIRILKFFVTITCVYVLFSKLGEQSDGLRTVVWPEQAGLVLVVVLFFAVFNWYLEAWRWKYSIVPFEKITINGAWKDVLTGLALNLIFPFTSGDFTARILSKNDRYQAISAVILNRGVMLFITVLMGIFSVAVSPFSIKYNVIGVLVIITVLIVIFLFRSRLKSFWVYFKDLPRLRFWKIISVSILRYMIFTLQFFMILKMFNPAVSHLLLLGCIGWVFMTKSFVPSLFAGLGLRETSAVMYLGMINENVANVVMPVFLIWIFNTALPSFIGLIMLWRLRTNIAK